MLKKLVPILVLACGIAFGANAQKDAHGHDAGAHGTPAAPANGKVAEIKFEETMHNFGDIHQGDVVTYIFKFKNTGKAPLIISNVLTQCGCTVPEWPKEPILPGKKGEIKATFNSSGKMGAQNKVVTIQSNASNATTTVTIVANVLPQAATPAAPAGK